MTTPTITELEYPVNCVALNRIFPKRYPYLLESAATGKSENNRFDILFAFPGDTLSWETLNQQATKQSQDFLSQLNSLWQSDAQTMPCPDDLPFAGGWFIFMGYEIAAEIEHRLHLPEKQGSLPHAFATRIPVAIINDHHIKKAFLVAEAGYPLPSAQVIDDLRHAGASWQADAIEIVAMHEDVAEDYLNSVKKIKSYIYDGDVYQVNVSRQWSGCTTNHELADALYHNLRRSNPAPFAGIVKYQQQSILSSSPERLVKIKAGKVDTRPIAGTRARGASRQDDNRLEAELLGNLKERAEHLMLLDLERNDLGRVCKPGSVEVTELMVVEQYAHVQHIVSNVSGRLRGDVLPGDVLRAVFPGGTITGCPKERCMAIIAELEQVGRGAYTGSMGYLNHDGSMDMNILIRTIEVDGDRFRFRAGAGIVADSDAERELQETRIKAEGMIRAFANSEAKH
jgi:anthranilate synthase component 1